MNREEAETLMRGAIGRLFRIMSRPYQPGDDEQYAACRSAVFEAAESLGMTHSDKSPNFAKSYHGMVMRGEAS